MCHFSSSETGMVVQRLLRLEEVGNELCMIVRWKELLESENSVKPIANIYKDVLELFKKLLQRRRNTPAASVYKAIKLLDI